MESDFKLFLRGNAVEAASARVTLNVNDAETVAGVFADAFESLKSALVDAWFDGFSFFAQSFLFLASFADDLVEFGFLFIKNVGVVGEFFFCHSDLGSFIFNSAIVVVDVFFGQFDFESLELDFFCEKIKLAVVADIVELLFITGDETVAVVDLFLFSSKIFAEFFDFASVVFDTTVKTFDTVFEVFDFKRKFAADSFDAVNFRKDSLKVVKRFQTLLNRGGLLLLLFSSHIFLYVFYRIFF